MILAKSRFQKKHRKSSLWEIQNGEQLTLGPIRIANNGETRAFLIIPHFTVFLSTEDFEENRKNGGCPINGRGFGGLAEAGGEVRRGTLQGLVTLLLQFRTTPSAREGYGKFKSLHEIAVPQGNLGEDVPQINGVSRQHPGRTRQTPTRS